MRPHDKLIAFPDPRRKEARISSDVTPIRVHSRPTPPATLDPVRDEPHAHHPEYPLERLCVHAYEPFQLTFARHARQLVHECEEVELVVSHQGLTIRGETEEDIEGALESLKEFYGPQIRVSPPAVRYHHGVTLEQPWMGLRVRCASEQLEAVKIDLIVRDATLVSSEIQSHVGVIQACAPLCYLIGYRAALARLTGGSGEHLMWLSHYAPVQGPPSGGDAA
jgi:hypothetical protein